jgi:hypothetical protein
VRTALVVTALLLSGCPKDKDETQFDPANDRTLQKLKAEQERLAKAGAPKQVTPKDEDPLSAAIAAPIKSESLGIPAGVEADLGPVTLTLIEVQQSQTAGSGKVSLTTGDRFLRVTLDAKARDTVELDLSGALLVKDEQEFHLARDVQRAAKGSSLITRVSPGGSEKLTLYFEVPPEVISKGLKIILTHGESRVELVLQ